MKGIQYLTDSKGRRTAVQIDLRRYASLWRDLSDAILVKERLKEPRVSLEAVERTLQPKPRKRK